MLANHKNVFLPWKAFDLMSPRYIMEQNTEQNRIIVIQLQSYKYKKSSHVQVL